jgi:hypothetical protein
MSDNGLTFRRLPYDDAAWRVELCALSGAFAGSQEIHTSPAALYDLGARFSGFPRDRSDEVRLELGGRTGNWACYVLLCAHLLNDRGHAAIQFACDNRRAPPYHAGAEFFITCDVPDVQRLGALLRDWSLSPDEPLVWTPQGPVDGSNTGR